MWQRHTICAWFLSRHPLWTLIHGKGIYNNLIIIAVGTTPQHQTTSMACARSFSCLGRRRLHCAMPPSLIIADEGRCTTAPPLINWAINPRRIQGAWVFRCQHMPRHACLHHKPVIVVHRTSSTARRHQHRGVHDLCWSFSSRGEAGYRWGGTLRFCHLKGLHKGYWAWGRRERVMTTTLDCVSVKIGLY
jgi:hypothetical protein